jgi:NAD(P)-dependent dehydrogenase (short-subunit alcohol dehydrogenase family)
VNIASVNAWLPDPGVIDYGAAKAALWNFTKALSKEVAPRGIRVNCVAPGPVDTARWGDEVARESVLGRILTGRLTDPDEVAVAVVMLASDRSGNTTGATYTVDGGIVPTL